MKDWESYEDTLLVVNAPLFNSGITALTTTQDEERGSTSPSAGVSANSFVLGSRTLKVHDGQNSDDTSTPDRKSFQLVSHFIRQAINFMRDKRQGESLTHAVEHFITKDDDADAVSRCIFNPDRREEVFLPVAFHDEKYGKLGMYLYPWASSSLSKKFVFPGIERWVTAGCLFGSSLSGRTNGDQSVNNLIKHDIMIFPGQMINGIKINVQSKPYEKMLFRELKKLACFIANFSEGPAQRKLFHHLPDLDYVVFGMQLFVQKKITLPALNTLFKQIFIKKEEHTKKIKSICERYDISVEIHSPFKNLFRAATNADDFLKAVHEAFIDFLPHPGTNGTGIVERSEQELVKFCLKNLTVARDEMADMRFVRSWQDFVAISSQSFERIEDLFGIANPVMLAVAAYGTKDYTTCSLLPLSEKPIQIEYAQCKKKLMANAKAADNKTHIQKNEDYPQVINYTTLDPLAVYFEQAPKQAGLVFYCTSTYDDMANLSTLVCKKLLLASYKNVVASAKKEDAVTEVATAKKEDEVTEIATVFKAIKKQQKGK